MAPSSVPEQVPSSLQDQVYNKAPGSLSLQFHDSFQPSSSKVAPSSAQFKYPTPK